MTINSTFAIKVENLTKEYAGKVALNKINLGVEYGQIVALLGPNGSGKSTLLKILGTLIKPTQGSANVNGYCVKSAKIKVRKSLGFVFQSNPLDKQQTVINNLQFAAALFGVPPKEARENCPFVEIISVIRYVQSIHKAFIRRNAAHSRHYTLLNSQTAHFITR